MEVTVNTTNNENAKITLDEKALTSLIKDIVGSQATTDFARALSAVKNMTDEAERRSQFWRNVDAKENFRNNLEQAVDACTNCVKLNDIIQASAPVPPTQPITPAEVPADIRAKVEEPVTAKKDEAITEIISKIDELKEEVMTTEEIIAKVKADTENEMSTRMIMFELCRMPKGELVERAQHWMEVRDTSKIDRQTSIQVTKYCVESREAFDCESAALNTLRAIGNEKFNKFLGIVKDVKWICE